MAAFASAYQRLKGLASRAGPRAVINLANAIFMLLILGLSLDASWEAVRDYRSAEAIKATSTLGNELIRATALTAMERGITSAVLGGGPAPDPAIKTALLEIRGEAEHRTANTLEIARALHGGERYRLALQEAERTHAALHEARIEVDRFLATGALDIDIPVWIERVARFNMALEKLRSTALEDERWRNEMTRLNLSLRHWIWLVSEYAGLERGTLAFFISRREPIPVETLQRLWSYRSIVEHNLGEIRSLIHKPDMDPRLQAAEREMRAHFHDRFNEIRGAVYAAADSGAYPVSGHEWVLGATEAINSVLLLAEVGAVLSDEMADEIRRQSLWHLFRHFILVLFALGLALLVIHKVRQAANQMFREKELAEVTLHSIGDAVITTDADGVIEYLNPIAEQYTGLTNAEVEGKRLTEVLQFINGYTHQAEEDPISECLRLGRIIALKDNTVLRCPDGREIAIEDSAAPIHDSEGRIVGAVMVFYDVTANSSTHHLLAHYASHDALTGLANRREFDRRLNAMLIRARRRGEQHALCYIDLDQFKVINDTCGHMVGDKLLCQLTYLLQRHIRDTDTLARLGGDEFGLLLHNCPLERAQRVAETIRSVIKQFRFSWEGSSFDLACSIGLVPITADSISPAEILSEADAACFAAKDKGRNRVQLFQPGDAELARRHGEMQWVSRLQAALRENRLELFVQEIVPLREDYPRHHEILLRLRDEYGGLVPPMSFIPAAERYNLMPEIDQWVIRSVCDWIRASGEDDPDLVYNINLSGASISEHHSLRDFITTTFRDYGIPPERACFEITETAAVRNLIEATELISELKKIGFRFALDDFGSGLSSFMYLKTLPVDFLKIDGNFVRDMVGNPIDHAMVEAINRIGHVMNIRTVAEFVENDAILHQLRGLGVDYGQGYGLGRPRPLRTGKGGATQAEVTPNPPR